MRTLVVVFIFGVPSVLGCRLDLEGLTSPEGTMQIVPQVSQTDGCDLTDANFVKQEDALETTEDALPHNDGGGANGDDDMSPPPPMPDLQHVTRASCKAHLQAGAVVDGPYSVIRNGEPFDVWCDMTTDDGGWTLVYSNANNWADEHASDLQALSPYYHWYDSTWKLTREASVKRLGRIWNGQAPLRPEHVGGVDVAKFYEAGLTEVRFEFIRGADGKRASGWCSTSNWNFHAGFMTRQQCAAPPAAGNNGHLCLSGSKGDFDTCDLAPAGPSVGWAESISMAGGPFSYMYMASPNQIAGHDIDHMVNRFNERSPGQAAVGEDFQVRIWLREP